MDVEAIVNKHLDANWCGEDSTGYDDVAEAMRDALTELAAGYERELRLARMAANEEARYADELKERIRQLEAERVLEGWRLVPVEPTPRMCWAAVAEYELATDDRLPDADGHDYAVVARLFRAMLAAAPQPKKEG